MFSSNNFVSKQVSNSTKCHYVKELGFESCCAVKPVVQNILAVATHISNSGIKKISGLTTQNISHGLLVSIDIPTVGEIVS